MTHRGALGRAIGSAGLLAGGLDLLYACSYYGALGVRPIRILQSVASGLLGRASFRYGWRSALLGLLCQFLIATCFAAAYILASQRWRWLNAHFVVSGLLYGACMYLCMHLVVLPLSAAARPHPRAVTLACDILAHLFLIGLPIAWVARGVSFGTPQRT